MSHRIARAAGLAVCALALAVAPPSAGAAPTASASRPAAVVVARALAPTPKPKKPRPASVASRLRNRKPVTRRGRAAATTPDPRTAVAAIPPIVQLPIADLVLQGGPSTGEAFAAMPVVPAPAGLDGRPLSAFGASAERMLESMMDRARSQLGTRYVLGGNVPGRGLDCSSFARFAMEALGITLPRTAAQQAQVGDAVPRDRAKLRPGDLLTFGRGSKVSHVGIYLGDGRFIHASVTSGRIIETTIERNARLFRRWLGARRLVASGDSTTRRDG